MMENIDYEELRSSIEQLCEHVDKCVDETKIADDIPF